MPKAKRARKTGGRSKGTPNKVTAAAREVMALLVEANAYSSPKRAVIPRQFEQ